MDDAVPVPVPVLGEEQLAEYCTFRYGNRSRISDLFYTSIDPIGPRPLRPRVLARRRLPIPMDSHFYSTGDAKKAASYWRYYARIMMDRTIPKESGYVFMVKPLVKLSVVFHMLWFVVLIVLFINMTRLWKKIKHGNAALGVVFCFFLVCLLIVLIIIMMVRFIYERLLMFNHNRNITLPKEDRNICRSTFRMRMLNFQDGRFQPILAFTITLMMVILLFSAIEYYQQVNKKGNHKFLMSLVIILLSLGFLLGARYLYVLIRP